MGILLTTIIVAIGISGCGNEERPEAQLEQTTQKVEQATQKVSKEDTLDDYCQSVQENDEENSECKLAIISAKTEVDTDSGKFPIEEGTYVRVISIESIEESSYLIEWYGKTAKIPSEDARILEDITPEKEEQILQRKTAGVITP